MRATGDRAEDQRVAYYQNGRHQREFRPEWNPSPPDWTDQSTGQQRRLNQTLDAEKDVIDAKLELRRRLHLQQDDQGRDQVTEMAIDWAAGMPERLRPLANHLGNGLFRPTTPDNEPGGNELPASPGYLHQYAQEIRERASP